jgi:hypothetical protein
MMEDRTGLKEVPEALLRHHGASESSPELELQGFVSDVPDRPVDDPQHLP